MGADIKSLRIRIHSVDSTLHLTKAMGLVASSKMRRANEAMLRSRAYSEAVNASIRLLTSSKECLKSPYMRASAQSGEGTASPRTRLIVIAGDRGLAGGYNANIFRTVREYPDAEIIPIGKRACDRFKGKFYSSEHFTPEEAFEMALAFCEDFTKGEYDRLGIVSTKYVSIMTQEAHVKWLLPLSAENAIENTGGVIFEPDEMRVLKAAVPIYISGMLIAAVRESFACEVAARRMAMDSAGRNAEEMINSLQLEYNRARQGAITQEITEIVAGSGM